MVHRAAPGPSSVGRNPTDRGAAGRLGDDRRDADTCSGTRLNRNSGTAASAPLSTSSESPRAFALPSTRIAPARLKPHGMDWVLDATGLALLRPWADSETRRSATTARLYSPRRSPFFGFVWRTHEKCEPDACDCCSICFQTASPASNNFDGHERQLHLRHAMPRHRESSKGERQRTCGHAIALLLSFGDSKRAVRVRQNRKNQDGPPPTRACLTTAPASRATEEPED